MHTFSSNTSNSHNPIPLLKQSSLSSKQRTVHHSNTHYTNPFGPLTHTQPLQLIRHTTTNNTTQISPQSSQILSPITPNTPYINPSPLYHSPNTNPNTNSATNQCIDESIVQKIELTLIHNPNNAIQSKYRWSANIQSYNGIKLSNKLTQTLRDTTLNANLSRNAERMDFVIDINDTRLEWLLPFDISPQTKDTPTNNAQTPNNISNKYNNINNINNSIKIEFNHSNNIISEEDVFGTTVNTPKKAESVKSDTKGNESDDKSDKSESESNEALMSERERRNKKYKYGDRRKEAGYCTECHKQYDGWRGLVSHKRQKHGKNAKNTKVKKVRSNAETDKYVPSNGEDSSESEYQSESEYDTSESSSEDSLMISISKPKKRKRDTAVTDSVRNKKRKLNSENEELFMDEFISEPSMKPIVPSPPSVRNKNETLFETDEGEEFDVEKIHSRKEVWINGRRVVFFLVGWKGYALKDSTWVPRSDLGCEERLQKFSYKIMNVDMKDCANCKLEGFDTFTKPCFKHHFALKEYKVIFDEYNKTHIRQLAKVKVEMDTVRSYM